MDRNPHITKGLRKAFVVRYAEAMKQDLRMWEHKSIEDLFEVFAAHIYKRSHEGPMPMHNPTPEQRKEMGRINELFKRFAKELKGLGYQPRPELLQLMANNPIDRKR